MIAGLIFAALAAPSCWDVFDAALAHSAKAKRPAYVSYDERIFITQNEQPMFITTQHIRYNDDGIAQITDDRFAQKITTRFVEPGPPELGPYGANRDLWIPVSDRLPVIATARANGRVTCTVRAQTYEGRDTYHLSFDGASHLTGLWVDAHSLDIWKVRMTAPGYVSTKWDPSPLADYQIELGYHGPYLVVERVIWNYNIQEQAQSPDLNGEYRMTNYEFAGKDQ